MDHYQPKQFFCSSESTSKYFKKENDSPNIKNNKVENQNYIESPYRDLVKDQKVVLNDTATEEDDFKASTIIKKPQKVIDNKNNEQKKVKKTYVKRKNNKSKTKQTTLVKMLEKQFSNSECNPEHVQMAVALSKSEQPDQDLEEDLESGGFLSTQQKILNVRATLEQFGFKSNKETDDIVVKKESKRSKNSKFRYITPTLFTKTQEDRELEIAKKVSLILSQNLQPTKSNDKVDEYDVSSNYLEGILNFNSTCFFKSALNNLQKEHFYVPILNLPQSTVKCGSLLKDWSKIPGRDKSPYRNNLAKKSDDAIECKVSESNSKNDVVFDLTEDSDQEMGFNEQNVLIEKSICDEIEIFKSREISPDLFSSDDEIIDAVKNKPSQIAENISPNTLKPLEITLSPNDLLKPKSIDSPKKIAAVAFSASMMSNFKSLNNTSDSESDFETFKSTKGIDHFESFNIDGDEFAFSISQRINNKEFRNSQKSVADKDLSSEFSQSSQSCRINSFEIDDFNQSVTEISEMGSDKLEQRNEFKESSNDNDLTEDSDLKNDVVILDLTEDSDQEENSNQNKSKFVNKSSLFNNYEMKNDLQICDVTKNKFDDKLSKNNEVFDVAQDSDREIISEENKKKLLIFSKKSSSEKSFNPSLLNDYEINFELNVTDETDHKLNDDVFDVTQNSDEDISSKPFLNQMNDYEIENELQDNELNFLKDQSDDKLSNHDEVFDKTQDLNQENKLDSEHKEYSSFNHTPNETLFNLNVTDYIYKILNENNDQSINKSKEMCNNDVVTLDLTEDSDQEEISKETKQSFNDYEHNKLSNNLSRDSDQKMNSFDYNIESDDDCNIFEHQEYCKININKYKKFIEYLNSKSNVSDFVDLAKIESQKNNSKSSYFNNDISFINDLISKPLENKDVEEAKLFEEIFTPKKFRKSISSDQCKSIRKPTPKKFKRSLTFSSPSETKKTIPFYFKPNENVEEPIIERNDSSESICISDEEINYSSIYSTPKKSSDLIKIPTVNPIVVENPTIQTQLTHKRIIELSKCSPSKSFLPPQIDENCPSTPEAVVIKTRNITPMPNYDRMNTPTIAGELEKIGVKNLKRHRGVQILKHIYYSTHPVIENGPQSDDSDDDDNRCVKRRKSESAGEKIDDEEEGKSQDSIFLRRKSLDNECVDVKRNGRGGIEIVGDIPESDELIFERKSSKKIHSCALPLHIAWFNFLTSNPEITENVLLYVPLQLEVLYEMLKEQGLKYHIQDLLTFLDKKCITIRTNQQGGQKRQRKNKD